MMEMLVDAAVRGSVIALLAAGLTLVQGTLRFANVAHVEFATLAAYGAAALTGAGLTLWAGSVLSVAGVAVLSVILYRILFRRLLASGPMIALIGALAVAIIARALLQFVFGSRPLELPVPLTRGMSVAGAIVTPNQIRLVVIAVALLAVTLAVLRWTKLGRSIRAVAADPDLAEVSGLNRNRIADVLWLITAALAGTAGILLAMDSAVGPELGFNLLLPVFAAAIVGGLGSITGAILAAYSIALAEAVILRIDFGAVIDGMGYIAVSYRPAIGFVLLVAMLAVRPQGLMGKAVRRG